MLAEDLSSSGTKIDKAHLAEKIKPLIASTGNMPYDWNLSVSRPEGYSDRRNPRTDKSRVIKSSRRQCHEAALMVPAVCLFSAAR
ncbi:MAG: hypothetical protein A4E65_02910 [Syntrophorhabdus sp. PtaU1.Bin153]|nr:MAG: hypothetical protein A4E65_02910 [Syntrophorhabdus sp. PtaU1.Bin153]